jgi:hypothetical protein
MRGFVMDGNFSAEHMAMRRPEDDVMLTDGAAFMVGTQDYKAHLAEAQEDKKGKVCLLSPSFTSILNLTQRSTCNNHRAVSQANANRHNLEATGIGATACARHGCFCPHSVVDFQKGERQMNMDYSFCQAVSQTAADIPRVLLMYDIACQYCVNLWDRVGRSSYLSLPPDLEILKAIGVWHVHGHVSECFPRYYPGFVPGSGHVDGEIIETLWSHLNQISGSTRGMSTAHRRDIFDDHMNDSNWKKLGGTGTPSALISLRRL